MSFIVQHILDDKGNKRGTLYAQGPMDPASTQYMVGWAMCNKKDSFSKQGGVALAMARAQKYTERPPTLEKLPFFVLKAIPEFLLRCDKYFQGKRRPGWTYGE